MNEIAAFMSAHPWLVAMAVAVTALAISGEMRSSALSQLMLTPAEAVMLINQGAAIVDVRSEAQFSAGRIVQAKHTAAQTLIDDYIKTKNLDKEAPLLVCDQKGAHSPYLVKMLRQQGINKTFGLKGGMLAWQQASLPLTLDQSS